MSRADFIVTYDGPALADSEMDARELSPALVAISDLVDRANTIVNGDRATAKVVVRASFRSGCFGIDLGIVQSIWDVAADLLASKDMNAALNLATILGLLGTPTGLIWLVKKLRGRPIRRIEPTSDGKVELQVDDERFEVEEHVLALLRDREARQTLEQVVYKPLEKDGIDTFAAQQSPDSTPVRVSKAERHFFRAPAEPDSEFISEDVTEELLQLVSVVFRDDNKWRFTDGVSTFYADMLDENFVRQVEQGRPFSATDLMTVVLLRRRYIDGRGKLKTEMQILEVLRHRPGGHKDLYAPDED